MVMAPVTVAGLIFHQRRLYERMACFLFFAMIFNKFLKHIFRIPLFPHLGTGYAFPSGHMHSTLMFYGYVLYRVRDRRIRALMLAIMLGEAFSLVYFRFHDLADLLGALGFSLVEILCYHQLTSKFGEERGERYALAAAIGLALLSVAALGVMHGMADYVWFALYSLLGIVLAGRLDEGALETLGQRLMALLMSGTLIWLLFTVYRALDFRCYFLSEMKFLFIAPILIGSINFSGKLRLPL